MDDYDEQATLEQGRNTLQLLSRQLQEQKQGDQSVGSSHRQNLQAERKLLDQKPRGDRLKNRKGSPLGLTLEELDDRGLLDGGGVVPSYYTSLKQKQRRSLELQRRSSRLKHRGHEDQLRTNTLDSLMRMIRVLIRKGTNFEDLFHAIDLEARGIIEKDQFIPIIRQFGLPFTSKEISAFAQRYSVSNEHMDYEAFLQEVINNIEPFVDGDDSIEGGQHSDVRSSPLGNTMRDLKRMLNDSKSRLDKSFDDIYRMFSCWDSSGRGTVTSTQFFRVLAQLHVTFSDQEQDFIVELLDTKNEGKINFDALLSFCFDSPVDDDTANGFAGGHQHVCEGGDESVVSIEGGSTAGGTVSAELRSVTSGSALRRPHTATAVRSNLTGYDDKYQDDGDSYTNSYGVTSPIAFPGSSATQGGYTPQKQALKRPLTASARVLHSAYSERNKVIDTRGKDQLPDRTKPVRHRSDDGHNFILDISSDSDNEVLPGDRRAPMGAGTGRQSHTQKTQSGQGQGQDKLKARDRDREYYEDGAKYNSYSTEKEKKGSSQFNRLTDSDNFNFASMKNTYPLSKQYNGSNSRKDHHQQEEVLPVGLVDDDKDYLRNVLKSLRKAIVIRHNQHGLSLREIFDVFDKRGIRYIDAGDLMKTSLEFNINISYEIAKAAVQKIALDGVDRISFSEFAVWISDPDHLVLQQQIQIQISEQLEQQGREYQYLLYSVLSQGDSKHVHTTDPSRSNSVPTTSGLVTVKAFVDALKTIGLTLSGVDTDRLVLRFDTHGSDQCSVSRFMRMAQNNRFWKSAIETLAYHEEAVEEAQVVRQRMHSSNRHAITTHFDDETLDMAEYLGIRVLSEPHLLWIVNEAIKAPLPKEWTTHQDKEGRTFFFNTVTQVTRWDHPADPQLRKMRDYHRRRHIDQSDKSNLVTNSDSAEVLEVQGFHEHHNRNDPLKEKYDTYADTNKSQGHHTKAHSYDKDTNPKINTILLYNSKTTNLKVNNNNKKPVGPAKATPNYIPKRANSASEKKRAVSAGRLRKHNDTDPFNTDRKKVLDRMFSDNVIEELDLAMQPEKGVRPRPQRVDHNQRPNAERGWFQSASSNENYKDRSDERRNGSDTVWL